MRKALVFEAGRNGYSIGQIADEAMTVGELIQILSDYEEDTLFVLSHDKGYTFGSIQEWNSYGALEDTECNEWITEF